ncbi:MAG: hypothetical protein ACD_79C01234G0009 [uncultured bacterium]|nr:MAG: hypothetical protein ACD_79C01234G0009 [uncultured bacterium]
MEHKKLNNTVTYKLTPLNDPNNLGVQPRIITSSAFMGRDDSCEIVLSDKNISRKHAKIEITNDGIFIEDLQSSNGTKVNGKKIEAKITLTNGDIISIKPFEFKLEIFRPVVAHAPTSIQNVEISDKVIELKKYVHELLPTEIDLKRVDFGENSEDLRKKTESAIDKILSAKKNEITSDISINELKKEILDEALGLGPLEDFLADSEISEIMINNKDQIYVEKKGKLVLSRKKFISEAQVKAIIERIVAPLGRRIDESTPLVDARLKDGSRVNAIIPPLALKGCSVTIRKFSKKPFTIDNIISFGTMTKEMADFLELSVKNRQNIVISGGTGSGKTTLLNVISSFIPDDERIVTIEDAAELKLPQDHVVSLETRPPNIEGKGAITIRDLVKNSLRMRPDRIVVGECRGSEALDMLQAMNTGHDGSLTTGHANTPRDMLARLETMVLMAGMDLPSRAIREQISSAVSLIVQQSRFPDGSRKITHITEITGMENNVITMQDIFIFKQTGFDSNGKIKGYYTATGCVPKFVDDLRNRGIQVNLKLFEEKPNPEK